MAKVSFAVPIRPGGRPGGYAPFTGPGQPVPVRETGWNRIRNTGAVAIPGSPR
jgi:hypothetical protein